VKFHEGQVRYRNHTSIISETVNDGVWTLVYWTCFPATTSIIMLLPTSMSSNSDWSIISLPSSVLKAYHFNNIWCLVFYLFLILLSCHDESQAFGVMPPVSADYFWMESTLRNISVKR
jgi:hypothetical protein